MKKHLKKQLCLSKMSCLYISWETKDIKLTDNETVTLPALTRQKAPKHLYENYLVFCNDKDTDAAGESFPSISRGMFYEILTKITNGGEKMLTAVDYVTGVLVNDQVTLLQRIVDDLVSIDMKPVLSNYIAIMRTAIRFPCIIRGRGGWYTWNCLWTY